MVDFNTPNFILEIIEKNKAKFKANFKEDYLKQLQNIEWIKKRCFIKKRDNNECNNCQNVKDLQVHHTLYFDNKKLWEYENDYLITLCKNCHQEEHKVYGIGNFKRSIKYSNDILKRIDNTQK
jgi:5-methylcytosine-specific restriction endonuclease McrA